MALEDTLAGVPLFSQLKQKELNRLAKAMVERRFPKGHVIVKEGDQAVAFYILDSGTVEVLKGIEQERPQVLATLKSGDFFGEMALLDGYPRSASIRALEDTECLVLSRWDFLAELRTSPDIAAGILPILSRRLREADEELAQR
jgi:CRP-like cAMP-binding protein